MSGSNAPFDPTSVPCTCDNSGGGCPCAEAGGAERVLRYVEAVDGRLSPDQREWCLREIDAVEGHSRKDHEDETDAQVARGVLSAWTDYCRDMGMI